MLLSVFCPLACKDGGSVGGGIQREEEPRREEVDRRRLFHLVGFRFLCLVLKQVKEQLK